MIPLGLGVQLITRPEWGARRPRSVRTLVASFGTTCHWEGPRMGTFPHSSCPTKVRVIQDFHMDTRDWQDIAYTAVVCPHGYIFEGRWAGHRTAANGTTDGNNRAYAVCYLGGQGDPFTPAGAIAMRVALDWLDTAGGAGPGRNGHRDWKPTDCPGDDIYRWVNAGQPAGPDRDEEDDMDEATLRRIVREEVDARFKEHRESYIRGAGQATHESLNKALDPTTGSGSVIRKALLEMTERGVAQALKDGHPLDERLNALAPDTGVELGTIEIKLEGDDLVRAFRAAMSAGGL